MAKKIGKNPHNEQNELFKRLTRIFSGPLINYGSQVEKSLRKRQLNKFASSVRSTDGKHFKKQSFNFYDSLQSNLFVNHQRHQRYNDFSEMDTDAFISSCLDVYSDEMTTYSKLQPILTISCPNAEIKEVLKVLYMDILNLECNLSGWCRAICKFGDFFVYLDIEEGTGIKRAIGLPTADVERLEGQDKTNPDYVQFQINTGGLTLENWQVAHFRILDNDKYAPYGRCHKFDTRILMSNGIKEIKDVKIGDLIYSFDLEKQRKVLTKVLDVVKSGEKECFKLRTRHNFIETSKEHKILCYDKEKGFVYKNVLDFKIGDLLVINKKHEVGNEIKINRERPRENNFNGYWNNIELISEFVDEEFAKLFGFLIGDGWATKHHPNICLALGIDQDINDYYVGLLEKFSGKKCITIQNKYGSGGYAICNSKMLKTIFANMGFSGKFNTKRLPNWVYESKRNIQEAFLEGLYESDGSSFVDKWNCTRYNIEMSNEQLMKDIKTLVQLLGYKSSDVVGRNREDSFIRDHLVRNRKRSFYIYYYKSDLKQAKMYDNPYRNSDEYILEPIIEIKSVGKHETYDIYVENENHNFISNGIVTHNSILDGARRTWRQLTLVEDAMMAYRIVRSPERRVFYVDIGNIAPQDVEQYMQKIMNTMKRNQITDSSSGRVDLRYNPLPVSYLTKIPLLDGRNITIEQVGKEFEEGKELWVYSINDKTHKMVPGRVKWCGKNYSAKKMVKVWLDDDSYVMTAPEHPFVRRDGESVRADQLLAGDSLMPFYRKENYYGYESVYDPSKDKYVNTHRMVAEDVHKEEMENIVPPLVVHHKNPQEGEKNRFNNVPSNLQFMNFWEHRKMHYEHCENSLNTPEQLEKRSIRITKWNQNEENRKMCVDGIVAFNNSPEHDKVVQKLIQYNNSELHKEHNVIRSKNKKEMWGDKDKREKTIENMKFKFDDICFENIVSMVRETEKKISMDEFCLKMKDNEKFIEHFQKINKGFGRDCKKSLHRHSLRYWVQDKGYLDFNDFFKKNNNNGIKLNGGSRKKVNHKVSKVEIMDFPEGHDVYCMTIVGSNNEEDRHNFAVCSDSEKEAKNRQVCGIIVKNSIEDDYFIPTRGGTSGTRIESLPGGTFTGDIDDVKYLRDKLFAALKVPMSYLSRGEGADEDKSTLAAKDIRFARTIQRLQKSLISELTKIGLVHLYVLGYRNEDLLSFELSLNNPSKISELQELEHWRTKFDVATAATEGFFDRRWIAEKLFSVSEEEFQRCQRGMYYDRWMDAQLNAIAEGAGGEGGGGGGGLDALGSEDAGGSGELEAPDEAPKEDDSVLLAAPGKRNEPYLTPGAKGKLYFPVNSDKRDMGARKRSFQSDFAKEASGGSTRNIFKGYSDLKSLSKGISESLETNYSDEVVKEEKNIHSINYEIKQLLEKLGEEKYKKDKK
ncbi:MAG: portal protein [Nanoarchaeota archaeon]|nr:portal protein [Nanoarchaeota archaeon]